MKPHGERASGEAGAGECGDGDDGARGGSDEDGDDDKADDDDDDDDEGVDGVDDGNDDDDDDPFAYLVSRFSFSLGAFFLVLEQSPSGSLFNTAVAAVRQKTGYRCKGAPLG